MRKLEFTMPPRLREMLKDAGYRTHVFPPREVWFERADGQPWTEHDESVVLAMVDVAGER
jgi:hypothetical protein